MNIKKYLTPPPSSRSSASLFIGTWMRHFHSMLQKKFGDATSLTFSAALEAKNQRNAV